MPTVSHSLPGEKTNACPWINGKLASSAPGVIRTWGGERRGGVTTSHGGDISRNPGEARGRPSGTWSGCRSLGRRHLGLCEGEGPQQASWVVSPSFFFPFSSPVWPSLFVFLKQLSSKTAGNTGPSAPGSGPGGSASQANVGVCGDRVAESRRAHLGPGGAVLPGRRAGRAHTASLVPKRAEDVLKDSPADFPVTRTWLPLTRDPVCLVYGTSPAIRTPPGSLRELGSSGGDGG